ncbi:unnamed protein product [Rotaria socialis]|uniref:RING-type domain-containing protein n=3 Tax=Rotaria socialis TaxID=392032 RepID=A0A820HQG4_9BILA|nr:unnamed protein product [Rotaria socialis]CAF4297215.1 unnamed protein product [Rotaria socialis]
MQSSKTNESYIDNRYQTRENNSCEQRSVIDWGDLMGKFREISQKWSGRRGSYSDVVITLAGLQCSNDTDSAHCQLCGIQVSTSKLDTEPMDIHAKRSPTCPFVLSRVSHKKTNDACESVPSHEINKNTVDKQSYTLCEAEITKQVRQRTFSHWPHQLSPTSSEMIEAGFFSCNISDRVICIYCNIICQQWTQNSHTPCEIHRTLSPKCPYVIAMLARPQTAAILVINEQRGTDQSLASSRADLLRSNPIVHVKACNSPYMEITQRHASFETWSNTDSPSVDDLVRAGFFYTGNANIVTCFYCNESLQNWGPNDNPTIEHARWFPCCAYAEQLCGVELYRKIRESTRIQQEKARANDATNGSSMNSLNSSKQCLLIPDESTLPRLVAARLDLPISQRLLNQNFKLSIIKRCWEDQLRLKHEDFMSDSDLLMACIILQKQIKHIGGKKENILVPCIVMEKIREAEQLEAHAHKKPASQRFCSNPSAKSDVEIPTSSSESIRKNVNSGFFNPIKEDPQENKSQENGHSNRSQENNQTSVNLCVLCLEEARCLASMPCGHLSTCVPCGHSLRSCPICRHVIEGYMRIYL